MKQVLMVLWLAGMLPLAHAATMIYKCGPGGREFSQRPCADGTVVEGTDGRTAAQRAEAVKMVEQERRKATELERERRAQEKAKPAAAAEINGLARPAAAAASAPEQTGARKKTSKTTVKTKQPDKDFVAIEPVAAKKK